MSSPYGFLSGPKPRLFAHRGASVAAPENTLEAFRLAWEKGTPYLEMDLRLSADGHLMVIHDSSVRRTTGHRGRVEKMTFAALRQLDAGYAFSADRGRSFPYRGQGLVIPSFEEILESFPQARLNVEIKSSSAGVELILMELLRRREATERVVVASHDHELLERFRKVGSGVLTSFSKREVREFLRRLRRNDFGDYSPPGFALQVPEYLGIRRVVSPAVIEAAHRLGLEVHVWTVNEPLDMFRLLDWGVDGIMTDDPARAIGAVETLGRSDGGYEQKEPARAPSS